MSTSLVPSVAANSVQVMKMCQALGRLGHDVTLYCSHGTVDEDPFEFYGVERVFKLQRASRSGAGKLAPASYLARQTAAILKNGRADIYFSRTARLLYAAAPLGRPLMFEAHSVPLPGPRREALRPLYRLPNFARLVCISAALARDYLEAFPEIDPSKVLVAHDAANPMDLSEPVPDSEWPGREGAFQVGYVGGIYPGRGVETIVHMGRELPHVDFHVIGGDAKTVTFWKEEKGATDNVHLPRPSATRRAAPLLSPPRRASGSVQNRVTVHGGAGDTRKWMSPLKSLRIHGDRKADALHGFPCVARGPSSRRQRCVAPGRGRRGVDRCRRSFGGRSGEVRCDWSRSDA